jgi:hypothetical protein
MKTTISKEVIDKMESKAFGKNVYLLGEDESGIRYWLESPKLDCGWYWGFGYVETYEGNVLPARAKDIDSHSHIDSSFMGSSEYYDAEKRCFRKGEYIHNIYDCPTFFKTTFTEKEGWTLSELFKTFYQLSKSAEMFGKGSSNLTNNPCQSIVENKEWAKHINEVMIPAITSQIIKMLTPVK